ncbi:MAG: 3-deoxy-D-manno-octulosonate 8-phosphate phosphatase [Candidatus Taylorbacteria bacterium CG11_big_fil_rev_8_21_14_0_20_46_11]|uniref:3-deoxy-D-manno-octulosonate 8-phosphate phosphatase n=1 Tax=Candidatus Taylorbacteria bacterium CG11_big_fil_rev_8_21_14_0_20_46_11 TaxID=1975025 RepID=A0A2H0KCP8_9BACT|nr:MAG: 3-deoxy-D-manno-octulosonate 8-phosphate phosphatase [Candidatus Taylorbacteria bacterium CG11_big_fil_rev_8_21_14_0_20_46_11]
MIKSLEEKLQKIRLVVTDFDGIHTDGKVLVSQDGIEIVMCSRKDGLGIAMLKKAGIEVHVISKERNSVVSARCKKMNIPCDQGVHDSDGKLEILKRITGEKNLVPTQVLYMGDDVNDRAPLEFAGVAVTVADGHPSLMEICDYVTTRNGGDHAVREVAEQILRAQGVPISF